MNVKFLTMLLPLALLFTACDKNDDQPVEKPILSLLQQSSIQIDTVVAATDWVYGFKFRVKNDGFINQIGMKLPVTGSFNATLWNLDENLALKEVTLTGNALHQEVFEGFNDIPVTKDMTLGISIKASGFYKISKTDNSPFGFPIQSANFSILSFHEGKSSEVPAGSFPAIANQQQLSPCVDVVFIDQ